MKKPWKSTAETSRQSHQPSPTRSRSNIRSMKDRISGPIPIATPIDAGIPMANETQDNTARDSASIYDNDAKPVAPVGNTLDNRRDTNNVWPRKVSPQHVRVVQNNENDGSAAEGGDGPSSRIVTPSGGAHARQLSKNARMSYFSAESTNIGYKGPPKKKSALRGAIGRLFGRKKNTASQASTGGTESTQPTPEPRQQKAEGAQEDVPRKIEMPRPEHKRSVSMPVSEKDRALRSHSIGLKDRLAIESARDSLRAESNFSRRRPGIQSLRRSNRRSDELSGLTPRPASASEKISGITLHADDPREIGRAISSDNIEIKNLKRRSRSLTALALVEREQSGERRRSGEIRYWRASYDPEYKSPLSSAHPEQDEEGNATEEAVGEVEEVPKPPLEPFDFHDAGLAGMKITAAANLETRISKLEDRTKYLWEHFEEVNRFLKGLRADQMSLPSLEPMDQFLGGLSPRSRAQAQRSENDWDISTVLSTPGKEPQSLKVEQGSVNTTPRSMRSTPQVPSVSSMPRTKAKLRPDSTATIKGAAGIRSSSTEPQETLTIEHYTTLIALLDTERSARLALEAKVKTLDHQLSIMRNHPGHGTNGFGDSKASFGGSAFDDDSEDSGTHYYRRKSGPYPDEDDSAAYATPAEHDTTDDEVMGYNKSDRTLSLSQMTMQSHKKRAKATHDPLPVKQEPMF